MYQLYTGDLPYADTYDLQIPRVVAEEKKTPKKPAKGVMPHPIQKLLKKCWKYNPLDRPSMGRVLEALVIE